MICNQKKKRARRRFILFRNHHNIFRCQDCGKPLKTETHQFFCNKCHKKRKKELEEIKRRKIFNKYGTIDLR
jgi:Zn finger protein HypA/HybF involved in hydrogenase expression